MLSGDRVARAGPAGEPNVSRVFAPRSSGPGLRPPGELRSARSFPSVGSRLAQEGLVATDPRQEGIIGPGSRADALHVALATVSRVDVLVSWNFRHIVNLGRIRLFQGVNLEIGYGLIEIRTPKEVLDYE